MKTCYIIGAGDFLTPFNKKPGDLVIAADGGYDNAVEYGITCDLLIGDLDSVSEIPEGIEIIRHPVMKDETDMYLAYLEGARRGYKYFEIHGGTGGRIDHTYANFSLLSSIRNNGDFAILCDTRWYATILKNESRTFVGDEGDHLSIFAFGGVARGINLWGLLYPMKDGTLTPDSQLGISNSLTEDKATVEVLDGTLLVITEKTKKSHLTW